MTNVIHNFSIETKDGYFDMAADFNILVRSFVPEPIPVDYTTEKVPGRNGVIVQDRVHGDRKINAQCAIFCESDAEFSRVLQRINALLCKYETFYVMPDSLPGLRWEVSCDGPSKVSQSGSFGEFSLTFTAWNPYAESRDELFDDLTWTNGMWSWGQGNSDGYEFTTTTFTVHNAGDIAIDPRTLPFVLKFKGASTNLRIQNLTTGDDWQHTGTTVASDTVRIDGIRPTKNSLSILSKTNRKLITLAPGNNVFQITGTSGAISTEFYFRNYYM